MSDQIPRDVLIDILDRLPVETLVRLTAVCKSWHSLITSPKFISDHLNRTISNANDRLLVRHCTEKPNQEHYSLLVDGNDSFHQRKILNHTLNSSDYFFVVGSCKGLICLSDDQGCYTDNMFLWNPSIRKSVAMPKPNVTFESHGPFMHCLGFGYDSVTNDFKVVRIVHTGCGCDKIPPEVEIYTLETGRWRYISDKALPLMIVERSRQAYVNGAAHWMAFTRSNRSRNKILSFDMCDEVFKVILVPDSITHENSPMKRTILLVFQESLSLMQHCICTRPYCSIWIMKEYGVAASWAKLFRIYLSGGLRRPLGWRKNGEVVFATRDGNVVSLDPQSKRTMYFGIQGTFGDGFSQWHTFYTDTYSESLVLLDKVENPCEKKKKKKKQKKQKKKSRIKTGRA